ncbi:hypothetical protein IGI80_000031 [Enterococcus sp. DIV1420a]
MAKKQKYRISLLLLYFMMGLDIVNKQKINAWFIQVKSNETVQRLLNHLDRSNDQEQQEIHNLADISIDQQQYEQLADLEFQSSGNATLNVNNSQATLDSS